MQNRFLKEIRLLPACGILFLLAGGAFGKPPAAAAPRADGSITAVLHGLQSSTGYLRVSLYADAKDFPDGTPLFRRDISLQALSTKQSLSALTVTFAGLHPGTYAVCAFHDRTGSGKMTQDMLGIPLEEWGMSGNPRPRFRAPRFDEARLDLKARETKSTIIVLHD